MGHEFTVPRIPKIDNTCIVFLVLSSILTLALVLAACSELSIPALYVQDMYVPALNNKTTTFNNNNNSVFIDLKFERSRAIIDYDYKDIQMTLFYGKERGVPVGVHMFEGFNTRGKRRVDLKAAVEAPGRPWEEAVSEGSEVELLVQLIVIEKSDYWRPDVVGAHVALDASAHKLSNNPIQLNNFWSLNIELVF